MKKRYPYQLEFHISRKSREYYQFDETIYLFNGNVIFENFLAARLFAKKMNERRDVQNYPERAIKASQVNAMGLIDEILHLVVEKYREQRKPNVIGELSKSLIDHFGVEKIEKALRIFADEFPPIAVFRGESSIDEYLGGKSVRKPEQLVPNQEILLEELIMLWLANLNPAFTPYQELFDDDQLRKNSIYLEMMNFTYEFFESQPRFGPENQNLIEMLRSPAKESPHSLSGQLEYISSRWGYLIGSFLYRLLRSMDLIKEEDKVTFGFGGAGISYVYDYTGLDPEADAFSPDKDWMPNLVLMAKNIYVWLDQLSKEYKRSINRLDEIPEEELDKLASWGITGLWLIGVWERSSASQKIKQLRGNPEAVASAYSLFNYEVASDLGGFEAYDRLREKAWKKSIRMASDMVPNHMGIDSKWLIEHPDWFISLNFSPFPSYSFGGPNLSWDERVGIYLEDHYYDNSDAAVVFKRVDFWSGSEKYIYHGNDGTSMPWNDTAQLNYLIPEVRESVIQTILHVARLFPIIRFDAAMTLAKRHYQRLWFPEPGSGGDIPSRAEFGISKEQFNAAFPKEFWREVVDRVAKEVPDTLLLAEAFWLMEGYFVRTLGMHRVYNSAFMNMLRDEKNQEYRLVIKNTLEFDPEILKRYVNFMNNPDERTAVDQYGKSDKYFGICIMLATMPGLPMLGHGQVEGYTEKYGMEYKRAYWDETPDPYLVERHEREIFPLLRKRYLFAGVENFLLYDFFTSDGHVNEDVFAYSNGNADQRALVIYHNKYARTSGWIRLSSAYPEKSKEKDSSKRTMIQKSLAEGLKLRNEANYFCLFRDHRTGLQYIRNNQLLHHQGLYVDLDGYQYYVFQDFYEVPDNEQLLYSRLESYLDGRGVPDVQEAIQEIILQPVRLQYRELVNSGWLDWLIKILAKNEKLSDDSLLEALKQIETKSYALLKEVRKFSGGTSDVNSITSQIKFETSGLLWISKLQDYPIDKSAGEYRKAIKYLDSGYTGGGKSIMRKKKINTILLIWIFTHHIGFVPFHKQSETSYGLEQSRSWIDEWMLGSIIVDSLVGIGYDNSSASINLVLVKILTSNSDWFSSFENRTKSIREILNGLFADPSVQDYLQINRYKGVLWFNKESFDELIWWMYLISLIAIIADLELIVNKDQLSKGKFQKRVENCYSVIKILLDAENLSGYQVEKLMESIEDI